MDVERRQMKKFIFVFGIVLTAVGVKSQTMYVKRNDAYVRQGPGSYYPFVVVLQFGARIEKIGSSGDWFKVKVPENKEGWIAANCLSDRQSQAAMFYRISKGWSSAGASESALAAAIKGFAKKYGRVSTGNVESVLEYSNKTFTASELAAFDKPLVDDGSDNRGKMDLNGLDFKAPVYDPSMDEQAIGVGIAARLLSGGIVNDPSLKKYVNMIAAVLAESSEVYNWDFTVFVLNDTTLDGFACPGGYIFVTLGAIRACNDESMLAAIIAHEMGHVIGRNGLEEMAKRAVDIKADSAFSELDEETGWHSKTDQDLESMAQESYDEVVHRRLFRYEKEADEMSAVLCANAGYDPWGIVRLDRKVDRLSRTANPDIFGSDFSLHNDPAERYKLIREFVEKHFSKERPGARMKARFESEPARIIH